MVAACCPPAPFLGGDPSITAIDSGVMVQSSLIDAQFCTSWMPFLVTVDTLLESVGNLFHQEAFVDLLLEDLSGLSSWMFASVGLL